MNLPIELIKTLLNSLSPMDSVSRLFLSMQVFENELHYQKVRKDIESFNISDNTSDAFSKIFELLSSVSTARYDNIHLYPDEYQRAKDMFDQTIEYFESLEEYEKCHDLIFSRNRIFFCIKIIV